MVYGRERGNHGVEIGFGAANPRVMRVNRRDSHLTLWPYSEGGNEVQLG